MTQVADIAGPDMIGDGPLRSALGLFPDPIALFDPEDRLVAWNDHFADISGVALVAGLRFAEIICPAKADELVQETTDRPSALGAEMGGPHPSPDCAHEWRLADGRWIRVRQRRNPNGWSLGLGSDVSDLKKRETWLRLMFDANPVPMYVADAATLRFVSVNDAALVLYGYTRERFLTMSVADMCIERQSEPLRDLVAEHHSGDDLLRPSIHLKADGSEIAVRAHTKDLVLDGRNMVLASLAEVTGRQAAETDAQRSRSFLDSVIDRIPVGVFVKDMADQGRYVVYNRCGKEIVGHPDGTMVGRFDADIFSAEVAAVFAGHDADVMRSGRETQYDRDVIKTDQTGLRTLQVRKVPILDRPDGQMRYLLGVLEDVTERRAIASRLDHMAHHDALTGLPNRLALNRRLAEGSATGPGAVPTALLHVDIDGFKAVNDTLGHRIGDGLLCLAAERMTALVPSPDLVVSLGGDDFVLLVAGGSPAGFSGVDGLARRIIEVLSRPYTVEGQTVDVTASIGIANVPSGEAGEVSLRHADVALGAAKRAGPGTASHFSPEMDADARLKRELAADMRRAMAAGEFELHYQPFVTTGRGILSGFEALLRWRHPSRGLIPPDKFIPVAEDLGLIVPLGAWVLEQACRDAASWPTPLSVSVNVSPVQFRHDGLIASVSAALRCSGLDPDRLEIEITESVLLEGSDRNMAMLNGLKRSGIRIALDDFGIGYSSLGYLQQFSFDKVKIDRSFVRGLPHNPRSVAILRAIANLAADLSIVTTAEGIETEAQLACVTSEGCSLAQGYLLGRPQPAAVALERARAPDGLRAA